jgi:hypothetical protein
VTVSDRYNIANETLQDRVRYLLVYDCVKHGLARPGQTPEEYADERIDRMSNSDFLAALSVAIEDIRQ